jgi:hypothetical protein
MKEVSGVVGFFDSPEALIHATVSTRKENYEQFDAFSPYPIHGLDEAQGLKKSSIPFVTFAAGLTGGTLGFSLQYWTSVVSWPLNVGGKPFNSWPAFVPVMFELTVLFAGLCTVAAMFILNGLPNLSKKAIDPGLTQDRLALFIETPKKCKWDLSRIWSRKKAIVYKPFQVEEVTNFLKQLGASDVRSVIDEGWFA